MKRGLLELSLASWAIGWALQHAREAAEQLTRADATALNVELDSAVAVLERVHRAVVVAHAKAQHG